MTKYKCGCKTDGLLLVSTKDLLWYEKIEEWQKTTGVFGTKDECFYCWQERTGTKLHSACRYLKGKWVVGKANDGQM